MSLRVRRIARGVAAAIVVSLFAFGSAGASDAPAASEDIQLPYSGRVSSGVPAFEVKQDGGGIGGRFEITNPNSAAIALDGVHSGTGHALLAWNLGRGRGAVVITSNSQNTLPALDVSSQSVGTPTLAAAADIRANNASTTSPALQASTMGTGPALNVNHKGSSGDIATFQTAGETAAVVTRAGEAVLAGGVRSAIRGMAETMIPAGKVAPGDVLVVSRSRKNRVERAARAYSTMVVGVLATRVGVLLSDRPVGDDLSGRVPVGIAGVIQTKVTAVNGRIRVGDLLVTSRKAGHAMRGTPRRIRFGTVIGKALAPFGGGSGKIPVLVTLQ